METSSVLHASDRWSPRIIVVLDRRTPYLDGRITTMKILFCALPAYGHIYPLMPLAEAARAVGHDVHFATTGPFRDRLTALGFETHEVGMTVEDAHAALAESLGRGTEGIPRGAGGRPVPEFGGRLFIDVIARRTTADLTERLPEAKPDLIVYDHYEIGAAVVAHIAGIPAVAHAVSPRLPAAVLSEFLGDRLDRLWIDLGAEPGAFDATIGDGYVDIVPPMLQQPVFRDHPRRIPLRPIPFSSPDATVPPWIRRAQRPLVYVTLGTIVATDDVLRPVLDGLAELDVDVLVALGSAAGTDLGPIPANVHVEPFVDQATVLRHAALAVHHAGSGTTFAALATGTPQVLLPKGADQFFNGDLMNAAGLAPVLEPPDVTPDAVATAARAVLATTNPTVDLARDEIAAMPEPHAVLDELVTRLG